MIPIIAKEVMYRLRLESAARNVARCVREEKASVQLWNVRCEVCLSQMSHYRGPPSGIMCKDCRTVNFAKGHCTRIKPLAITRSAIREKLVL